MTSSLHLTTRQLHCHQQNLEEMTQLECNAIANKTLTDRPCHFLVTRCQMAADETEACSIEHERDTSCTLITFIKHKINFQHHRFYYVRIISTDKCYTPTDNVTNTNSQLKNANFLNLNKERQK